MATVAILSGSGYADIAAWTQALQAQGNTVIDAIGQPLPHPVDVVLFLPPVDIALAQSYWEQGRGVIALSSTAATLAGMPFVASAGSPGEFFPYGAIVANGSSPLAQGWTSFPIADAGSTSPYGGEVITGQVAGTAIFATYAGSSVPAGCAYQPAGAGSRYWIWLGTSFSAAAVAPNLLLDVAAFVQSQTLPGNACSGTQPCPAGQSCVNGVCLVNCGAGGACPPGSVCQGGVCVPSGAVCTGGVTILGTCVPWWAIALGLVGAYLLLKGGGGGSDGERRASAPRRRLVRARKPVRPRVITRIRTVRHRVTPHEASAVLHRRAEQLNEP